MQSPVNAIGVIIITKNGWFTITQGDTARKHKARISLTFGINPPLQLQPR